VLLQPLERRRLLAFSAAEYFPLTGGNTWDYAGVVNGHNGVARVSSIHENGETRFDLSQIAPLPAPAPVLGSNRFSLDAAGLKLDHIDVINDAHHSGDVTFSPGINLLNATANIGDVMNVDGVQIDLAVHSHAWGRISGKGDASGTARVIGLERVNLSDGRFVDALKVTLNLHYDGRAFKYVLWDLTGSTVCTYWLGPGIGVVKMDQTTWLKGDAQSPGVDASASLAAAGALTASPLIPADTSALVTGVLTVNGTVAADAIAITARDDQIISTRGGVSKSFSVAAIDVFAGDGNDLVTIGAGVRGSYVDAGPGNDRVIAGDNADTLTGGAGKDFLDGGAGDDRVAGNGGHDHLIGGAGNDRLYGGNENDTLEGAAGVDRIWGGAGDDLLAGNGSSDKLFGEAGNDTLVGGSERDVLDGGDGIDTFLLRDGSIDTANGGAGIDLLASSDPDELLTNM
jgi:Ca2+-binding RTX toxin-like protein